ncbi:Ulilysin [uncultured virus]|nr:Ulilysin [uncultured virus]
MSKQMGVQYNDDNSVIRIGVVFHICYAGYAKSTVLLDTSYSIAMMNRDFSKQAVNFNYGSSRYTRADFAETYKKYVGLAVDCNIQFYYVNTVYNPIASQSSSNISILDQKIKIPSPAIQPSLYLNIWVADLTSGILGYAQFPWDRNPNTDGVVIAKGAFGTRPAYQNFNLNKTMTHEVGHWLGLYHTFQDTFNYRGDASGSGFKGDRVADTPPQRSPTYGNPLNTPSAWPTSRPLDEAKAYKHMFMNFMDYSDDIALFVFTSDQRTKMRQCIHTYRSGIVAAKTASLTRSSSLSLAIDDPITDPTIEPILIAAYNFNTGLTHGWAKPLEFLHTSWLFKRAAITSDATPNRTLNLRTNKRGRAELTLDLTNTIDAQIQFDALVTNNYTYIWVKPPGAYWQSLRVKPSSSYEQYTYNLPPPFQTIGSESYRIRLGTAGASSKYTCFDSVRVVGSKIQA